MFFFLSTFECFSSGGSQVTGQMQEVCLVVAVECCVYHQSSQPCLQNQFPLRIEAYTNIIHCSLWKQNNVLPLTE